MAHLCRLVLRAQKRPPCLRSEWSGPLPPCCQTSATGVCLHPHPRLPRRSTCSPSLILFLDNPPGVSPSASVEDLGPSQWEALHAQWAAWLQRVQGRAFSPASDPGLTK